MRLAKLPIAENYTDRIIEHSSSLETVGVSSIKSLLEVQKEGKMPLS